MHKLEIEVDSLVCNKFIKDYVDARSWRSVIFNLWTTAFMANPSGNSSMKVNENTLSKTIQRQTMLYTRTSRAKANTVDYMPCTCTTHERNYSVQTYYFVLPKVKQVHVTVCCCFFINAWCSISKSMSTWYCWFADI